MTPQFETMLRLFGDGATGNVNNYNCDIDVDAVISLAHIQGVWTVVYPALSKVCDTSKYHLQFLSAVSDSIRRNEFTLGILEKIVNSGVGVCVLKGGAVSILYAEPDCRISSDVDILINPCDEKKVSKILEENGYTVEKRKKNDHHMKAEHPVGGLLEVHVSLYSHITDKLIFGGEEMYDEEWSDIEISGRKFKTLGINDNLNYLTAHYIKHFVTGGASIRQMMDLLLYIKKYEKEIDFEKYNKLLKKLRYEKLIDTVKTIGALYLGLDFEFCESSFANELLDDCNSVGLFGANTEGSANIYRDYCERRKNVSSLKTKILFLFKDENNIFHRLFPEKKVLVKNGYSYAKYFVLIPVAWCHHFIDAVFRRTNPESGLKGNVQLKTKRTELMKKLEMIE